MAIQQLLQSWSSGPVQGSAHHHLCASHLISVHPHLITPIPPIRLFELVESGYPIEVLLNVVVQSISGISHIRGGARARPADTEFVTLLNALRQIQDSGAVGLRVDPDQDKKVVAS